MVNVRRATPSDRNEWLRMRAALWPHAMADHPREVDGYLQSAVERAAAFVAERPDGNRLVAFLEVRLRDYADGCSSSPVAYIEGWYVDPRFRRRGIGAALVEAAEEWAEKLGLSEIASDSELHNDIGHRAHTGLGFQEVGRIVQFRKPLEPPV
jgi:aminoglycoside 6'-N-acetyltransferase I